VKYHDAGVSVYDRLVWPEGAVERLLVSGERRRELIAYLGELEYAELVPLAIRASAARKDPSCSVHVVPGIMGSQLGVRRPAPLPVNLLWIDPTDFHAGGITALRLTDSPVEPLGSILYTYLRLKLALQAAGFHVRVFDYDWRRGIGELGAALAQRLAEDAAPRLAIVGHSMGGLLGRVAVTDARLQARDIANLITLGTPHRGSYAPVQALRGTHATVRRIAQLDPLHSAEQLSQEIFAGFPALYDMLPDGAPDLFASESWPAGMPGPRHELLVRARELRARMQSLDARVRAIVGVGRDTVTAIERRGGDFEYVLTRNGDGTVPAEFARAGADTTWYARVAHSDLPRDAGIAASVAELLRDGRCSSLPATYLPDTQVRGRVTDTQLRADFAVKLDWPHLSADERRRFLDSLNEPLEAYRPQQPRNKTE
jgi:pimeloyl-ACP methyl ester carboxylesterase